MGSTALFKPLVAEMGRRSEKRWRLLHVFLFLSALEFGCVALEVGRRGGAFLSTTGSFTLSSGSNTAGNDEALANEELGQGLDDAPEIPIQVANTYEKKMKQKMRTTLLKHGVEKSKIDSAMHQLGEAHSAQLLLKNKKKKPAWPGAYNTTHVDENLRSDGPVKGLGTDGCQTQVTVKWTKGTKRNRNSCTSCKSDHAFVMKYHSKRTGSCLPYTERSNLILRKLNSVNPAGATQPNIIGTKVLLAISYFNFWKDKDGKVGKHFRAKLGKKAWTGVAKCPFRKETVCRTPKARLGKDGRRKAVKTKCEVKKSISCNTVCIDRGIDKRGQVVLGKCFKSLCKGEYGTVACRRAAMME